MTLSPVRPRPPTRPPQPNKPEPTNAEARPPLDSRLSVLHSSVVLVLAASCGASETAGEEQRRAVVRRHSPARGLGAGAASGGWPKGSCGGWRTWREGSSGARFAVRRVFKSSAERIQFSGQDAVEHGTRLDLGGCGKRGNAPPQDATAGCPCDAPLQRSRNSTPPTRYFGLASSLERPASTLTYSKDLVVKRLDCVERVHRGACEGRTRTVDVRVRSVGCCPAQEVRPDQLTCTRPIHRPRHQTKAFVQLTFLYLLPLSTLVLSTTFSQVFTSTPVCTMATTAPTSVHNINASSNGQYSTMNKSSPEMHDLELGRISRFGPGDLGHQAATIEKGGRGF